MNYIISGARFGADVDDELILGMVELAAHRSAESEPGAGGLSVEVEQAFRSHLEAAKKSERDALAERGVTLP